MTTLLSLSRGIDWLTARIGRGVSWLVVAAVLISAGNAVVRKTFDTSSNAWLELQWWLFALVVLLAAPWTLALNQHIRIDIVNSRLAREARNAIELVGILLFLLPMCAVLVVTGYFFFLGSAPAAAALAEHMRTFTLAHPLAWLLGIFALGEQSSNAGGLPQWPAKAMIPVGFALLFVQGISELIKRLAITIGATTPESGNRNGSS